MAPGLTTPLSDYHGTTTITPTTESKEGQSYTPTPTKEAKQNHYQPPTTTTITTPAHHNHHLFGRIKTSGQHPPLYDQIKPYSDFPKEITGPTVWKSQDYANYPERWTHVLTRDEIAEMSDAADTFQAGDVPLTHISKETFPLPLLSTLLAETRETIINGRGFILFRGFPVDEWGIEKSATAYMGLGTYFGNLVSQNGKGHLLGHVKDLGEDSSKIDEVRIYRTNARQFFHADDCDIVGLLCLHKAHRGGESDIVSSHEVFNFLQRTYPDVAETLTQPIWYFDRKGEVSQGEEEWIRTSVFYKEVGENGRVYVKWDPYYILSLSRFSDPNPSFPDSKPLIPAPTPAQLFALHTLERVCAQLSLHMILAPGDIQFLTNSHVLHARTAYEDFPPPHPRRHLLRLWVATPEGQGGWRLPFWDSKHERRGGVQVDGKDGVVVLDAE